MTKQLTKLFEQGYGFRNENISELHHQTSALQILDYEYKELGNVDIPYTMHEHGYIDKPTYKKAREYLINFEQTRGKLYGLWLCASEEDVIKFYPDDYDDPSVEEMSIYFILDQDAERLILSDLGDEGILLAQTKPFERLSIEESSEL